MLKRICKICFWIFMFLLSWVVFQAFALTDPAEKYPRVSLYLQSPELVREAPSWLAPYDLEYAPQDIEERLDILPYEDDTFEDTYIVVPQLGVIAPIRDIPWQSADFQRMTDGQSVAINPYLQNGVIHYPNTPDAGYRWNMTIFGHSNFFRNGAGNYKTIFATLMRLDQWDEIRIYKRNPQNSNIFDRYIYTITQSYPTRPSDVSPLEYDGEGADITLITCYYGLSGRWIVQWTLQSDPVDGVWSYPVLDRLRRMPVEKRNYFIIKLVQRLDIEKEKTITTTSKFKKIQDIQAQLASYYEE